MSAYPKWPTIVVISWQKSFRPQRVDSRQHRFPSTGMWSSPPPAGFKGLFPLLPRRQTGGVKRGGAGTKIDFPSRLNFKKEPSILERHVQPLKTKVWPPWYYSYYRTVQFKGSIIIFVKRCVGGGYNYRHDHMVHDYGGLNWSIPLLNCLLEPRLFAGTLLDVIKKSLTSIRSIRFREILL